MTYRSVGEGADASLQILLVTTRESGRWIVPKGNIDFGMSPHRAAAREAEEEAGVRGKIGKQPIGIFRYRKCLRSGITTNAKVIVFPLQVTEELDDWQERRVRLRKWFSPDEAADAVAEPDLQMLLRTFAASHGKR